MIGSRRWTSHGQRIHPCQLRQRQLLTIKRIISSVLVPLILFVGSVAQPGLAREILPQQPRIQQLLRQVPGPSPRQTIENVLETTQRADVLIHDAMEEGLTDKSWWYSAAQRKQAEEGQRLLDQATEVLNLSEVPQALHPVTGIGNLLMLRSLLLYDLSNHPSLVLPSSGDVARKKISSWTIPESPITLALNIPSGMRKGESVGSACQQCSEQDFLFTAHTVSQVESDFNRTFANDPALIRQFGGGLYITWSLTPGGDLPPKWIVQMPRSWKEVLVERAYGGQSLIQWLFLGAVSAVTVVIAVAVLNSLRQQFRIPPKQLGPETYLKRVGLLIPLYVAVLLWNWVSIYWINLTGDRAVLVVVLARIMGTAVAMPLAYWLAEAVGQSLILKRRRDADGNVRLYSRTGAGQLLTIMRIVGLTTAIAIFIQAARSLGLTSVTILALSSVPALAISLGTQQLIRDIFDGFSLFLDGQLRVGDRCSIGTAKSGQIDGTVLTMGMRSVVLKLKNGSELTIPNSQVAGSVVTNHTVRSSEPLDLRLALPMLETKELAEIKCDADELLLAAVRLKTPTSNLDHCDGTWFLHIRGSWEAGLASSELSRHRDELLIALHNVIAGLGNKA